MKTWKKIEETKKRTGEITHLKKRNEDKVHKVGCHISNYKCLENRGSADKRGVTKDEQPEQLRPLKVASR